MAKDRPGLVLGLDLDQRQRMLEALRARTAAATRAVQAASRALTDLKRATRAAQAMGEEKVRIARPEKKTTMPETNTHGDKPNSLPNGHGSTP